MTRVDQSAVVTRETSALHRGRALIVTLFPRYIEIRPKGTRGQEATVPYEAIYERALKVTAEVRRMTALAERSSRPRRSAR